MKTPKDGPIRWHKWNPGMTEGEEARLREGEEHFRIDRKPLGEPSHLQRMLKHLQEQEIEQCAYCKEHEGDSMMPPHTPSQHCESGRRPHCTCDICY